MSPLYPLCGSKISEELKDQLVIHDTVDKDKDWCYKIYDLSNLEGYKEHQEYCCSGLSN